MTRLGQLPRSSSLSEPKRLSLEKLANRKGALELPLLIYKFESLPLFHRLVLTAVINVKARSGFAAAFFELFPKPIRNLGLGKSKFSFRSEWDDAFCSVLKSAGGGSFLRVTTTSLAVVTDRCNPVAFQSLRFVRGHLSCRGSPQNHHHVSASFISSARSKCGIYAHFARKWKRWANDMRRILAFRHLQRPA